MLRGMLLLEVAVVLCGCAGHLPAVCRPTGWVDRVEGEWVVVEPDDAEAEALVLPLSCFREPLHGGLRLVDGRVDREATEALRRRMAALAARLRPADEDDDALTAPFNSAEPRAPPQRPTQAYLTAYVEEGVRR